MNEILLTPEGAEKLRAELKHLTEVKRPELAQRLRHAVQQGDLAENADYHMAKEQQAFLEGRILELETTLKHATIVEDGRRPSGVVAIGSRVTIIEEGADPEVFILVGVQEANPREGKISHESPIGRALMGRKAGEVVQAETPGGTVRLRIKKVA